MMYQESACCPGNHIYNESIVLSGKLCSSLSLLFFVENVFYKHAVFLGGEPDFLQRICFSTTTIFAREVFLLYLRPDIVTSPLVIIRSVGMLVPWF